jgi:minor extracellular serine protease Vpr
MLRPRRSWGGSSRNASSWWVARPSSAAVENAAKAYAPQVVRRYGSDRFRTAVEVSRDYLPVLDAEAAVLATGFQFPDALAAGPVAAAMGGPCCT